MKTLALDIAAHTGWSIADNDRIIGYGSEQFSAKDPFKRALQMREWFKAGVLQNEIDQVVVEQYFPGKITNFDVVRGLLALHTAVGMTCHELNMSNKDVAIARWRSHFIGVSKAPKNIKKPSQRTKWLKKAVIDKCLERGWKVTNDNTADALGIMDFVLCQSFPDYGVNTSPLFAGGTP